MNKNIKYISVVFLSFTLVSSLAIASNIPENQQGVKPLINAAREDFKNETNTIRESALGELQQKREAFKNNLEEERAGLNSEPAQNREEIRSEIKTMREEYQKDLEAKRLELKDKLTQIREKFIANLAKIKDEAKKVSVEKITEKLSELNIKATNNLTAIVGKIQEALKRVESRADAADARGVDTTAVRASISKAEIEIAKANAAILAHTATKIYSPESLTDTNLKTKMSTLKKIFNDDIKTLRDIVKVAHTAVKDAAVLLAQTPGIDEPDTEKEKETTEDSTVENNNDNNN